MWTRMNVYSPPSCPACELDRQVFWSASSLHYGWTATILRHCAGLPVRWAAFVVKMWVNCASVRWRWRNRAGGTAQWNADWQNHISVDILKEGNCFKVYSPLGVHYATPGTWLCTFKGGFFPSDQADGIETLCSVLIKNPEDQQVQAPSSKSLGDSPGVYREKEKMDLIKKTAGRVSREYIHFDEGWVWIDEIVLLNTKEHHLVVGSKMLSKLSIFSIHGLWSGKRLFFFWKVRLTSECDSLDEPDFCGLFLGDFRQWGLICLMILANRVFYSLAKTSKQSKDMPQAFFNIPRLLQTMVKFSLTFALHTCFYSPFPFHLDPYTFLGPKGACQLCPLEDLRRGCRHRLASAGYGGNGGTFPPGVVEFFCVGVLATRLKFRICCESLWPFIQAGFRDSVGMKFPRRILTERTHFKGMN